MPEPDEEEGAILPLSDATGASVTPDEDGGEPGLALLVPLAGLEVDEVTPESSNSPSLVAGVAVSAKEGAGVGAMVANGGAVALSGRKKEKGRQRNGAMHGGEVGGRETKLGGNNMFYHFKAEVKNKKTTIESRPE